MEEIMILQSVVDLLLLVLIVIAMARSYGRDDWRYDPK